MEANKKLTRQEAIATYLRDRDIRVSTIAAAAGVSSQRLYQWLEAAGVKPNRRSGQHRRTPRYTPRVEAAWTAEEKPVLSAVEGSREISACNGESDLGMEIPRLPSVATLLPVARNDGGRVVTWSESKSAQESGEP